MQRTQQADSMDVSFSVRGKRVTVTYVISDGFRGELEVTFPFSVEKYPAPLHRYLAASCLVVIASLVLPRRITAQFPIPQKANILKALEVVYDIRGYTEFGTPVSRPEVESPKSQRAEETVSWSPKEKHAVLCWSGGVDSTYAYLLLTHNGYAVDLLHTNINQDQFAAEDEAVRKLAKVFGKAPTVVDISFPELRQLGKRYSRKFAAFPSYNAIPFGRDIIHIGVAAYQAYACEAGNICFGYEREPWESSLRVGNKKIGRYDFQSEAGVVTLSQILKRMNQDLRLFSPIAGISKWRIYRDLSERYPHILAYTASCYFGERCGQCVNCVLYGLLGALTRGEQGSYAELRAVLDGGEPEQREVFAELLYVFLYDVITEQRNNPELAPLLRNKFGDTLSRKRDDVLRELERVQQAKLLPPGFRCTL